MNGLITDKMSCRCVSNRKEMTESTVELERVVKPMMMDVCQAAGDDGDIHGGMKDGAGGHGRDVSTQQPHRSQQDQGERGKKEKGREAEEEGDKEVKKDVMGWTVATRNKKQKRRTVQNFVKVNESKTFTLDVSPDDTISDVLRQIQNDEDVNVTMHGSVLKRSEKLRSCGVTDGCAIQVTSRMRGGGGGGHKDKKSKAEKKQVTRQEPVSNESPAVLVGEKDAVIRMLEETEEYRNIVAYVSEGSDVEMEEKTQYWMTKLQGQPGGDVMVCAIRWAVEARRNRRQEEQEQDRH